MQCTKRVHSVRDTRQVHHYGISSVYALIFQTNRLQHESLPLVIGADSAFILESTLLEALESAQILSWFLV